MADVDVDDAARAQDVIAPNALKQLFAAQNLTAVLGQVVQQFEFFWRQLKIFSVLDGAKRIEAQRDAVQFKASFLKCGVFVCFVK